MSYITLNNERYRVIKDLGFFPPLKAYIKVILDGDQTRFVARETYHNSPWHLLKVTIKQKDTNNGTNNSEEAGLK